MSRDEDIVKKQDKGTSPLELKPILEDDPKVVH
jgi:hypothetical protein